MACVAFAALGTALLLPAFATANTITTVAGNGTAGFAGDLGLATLAELNFPRSASPTSDGGFLIADRANDRVRRIWPDGTISTVAGNGTAGFAGDGGLATDAALNFLHDVTQTADGGFLISDTKNERIRYVSPAGTITTVAGSGPTGCFCDAAFSGDGGPPTSARLGNPHGISVEPNGNVLIADTDNNRIREISVGPDDVLGTSDDVISTVAGSGPAGYSNGGYSGDGGPATQARLRRPFDVDALPGGGFLIDDEANQVIREVSPTGTITTVAGTPGKKGFAGDGGPATKALLRGPEGVASASTGGFVIADSANQRIRYVTPTGIIKTIAGNGTRGFSGDGGPPKTAQLYDPKSVGVYPNFSGILIGDEGNQRIREVLIGP